jgi:hypothetical protein
MMDTIDEELSHSPRSHLIQSKFDPFTISQSLNNGCCKSRRCVQYFSVSDVQRIRERLFTIHTTQTDRRAYLSQILQDGHSRPGTGYWVLGKEVCARMFLIAFGISKSLLYHCSDSTIHRLQQGRESGKANLMEDWLRSYASYFEQQPGSEEVHITLPSKKLLYAFFLEDTSLSISRAYFYAVWHNRCSFLKLRKVLTFSVCDLCQHFREAQAATRDPTQLLSLRAELRQHLKFVVSERSLYRERCLQAAREPDNVLSIAIDGATQAAFSLPHFCQATHTSAAARKMTLHLVAAMVHHRFLYLFGVLENVALDSNLVVEILQRVLLQIERSRALPAHLYLQSDNTVRECRNKFVLAFLSALVARNVFQTITYSTLPVGHTHSVCIYLFIFFISLFFSFSLSRVPLGGGPNVEQDLDLPANT